MTIGSPNSAGKPRAADEFGGAAASQLRVGSWAPEMSDPMRIQKESSAKEAPMRSAAYDLTINSARADALFASPLQRSDEPSPAQVRRVRSRWRSWRWLSGTVTARTSHPPSHLRHDLFDDP